MTDNEIIKALNNADGLEHVGIHCGNKKGKYIGLVKVRDILDLINRQNAEIERLNKEVDRLSQCVLYHEGHIADAIKEFAERLDESLCKNIGPSRNLYWKISADIDNLVKERVGEG